MARRRIRTGLADPYRLVLIDARGHSGSDKPHDQVAYGRRRQAAAVVAVRNDLERGTTRFWDHSMGGDVALTRGRHHPERVSALVVTGYSPFAAAGDEAAEMAAWAADLQGGIEGFVAGYERRHGALPDDARTRWLANDGAALAACVAATIAESDGSQVADLPEIEVLVLLLVGTEEPFAEQARSGRSATVRDLRSLGEAGPRADILQERSGIATCPGVSGSNHYVDSQTSPMRILSSEDRALP